MSKIKYIQLPGSAEKHTIDADLLDGKHASEFAAKNDVNAKVSKSGDTMSGDLTINKASPALILKPTSSTENEYKESANNSGEFVISSRRSNSSDAWNDKIVLGDEYSTINNSFDIGANIRNSKRIHALDSWLPGKSANRTFGISPDCVIIEVSYDSGATWQDAGVSDSDKTEMFSILNNVRRIYEFPKKDGAYSSDVQVRLTFSNCNYSVPPNTPETQKYTFWNNNNYVSINFSGAPVGFYLGLYTASKTSYADIQMASMYRPDEWIDCKMNIPINNSGIHNCSYAMLDTTKYMIGADASTSYAHNIRITFRQSTVHQTIATAIYGIIMCGWITSNKNNSMCSVGVPYQVDPLTLKTTFDAAIAKRGGTSSQFLKADGSVDSNSYQISGIVNQIRQAQLADDSHYPSEKCVALIAEGLQSDIDDVATDVNNKEDNANKVSTLDNSDTHYPSAKAVKAAVDGIYDSLSALVQLVQTKEVLVNKVTSISAQSTDAQYPSAKAVFTALQNIQTNVYGTDAAINDVYISPSKRELQLTAGNKGGTIVYYELNQTANEYYLNVINASSMFHGGHSIVLENKTGYSTFITIDDNSFFGIPVVIRQYGNGIDKPAINLSNNQSIKIDYITNGSCVILTASYI